MNYPTTLLKLLLPRVTELNDFRSYRVCLRPPSWGDAGRVVSVGCGIFLELPLNETTGLLEFGILEKKPYQRAVRIVGDIMDS